MKRDKLSLISAFCLISILSISSCGQAPEESSNTESLTAPTALAFVNESPITADELDAARSRFRIDASVLDARFEDTLLKSLVSSRAMALLAEKELSDEKKKAIALKTAAYREELLVKEYLRRNTEPEPVSESMVRDYYDKHPEEFSGGARKEFEYFVAPSDGVDDKARKKVLEFFAASKSKTNWDHLLGADNSLPITYRKAKSRLSVLDEPMRTLVKSTASGEVSPVSAGDKMMIVRVLSEEVIPARPLAEVSADIRRRLAPTQLRKAVKTVSAQALSQVEVSYQNKQN